ncbi:hypothetical protein QE152_g3849 [Popillia japonica]|uniref:Uncharacterized protein n=1 Tax=Popillia japonica TaxID=7064 RepID=A0AAW1N0S4_POPJA
MQSEVVFPGDLVFTQLQESMALKRTTLQSGIKNYAKKQSMEDILRDLDKDSGNESDIKKTNRANIDEKKMNNAIRGGLSRGLSVHAASRVYGIKKNNLAVRY